MIQDKDKYKIIYFWYDHLVLRNNGDAEKVQKAIQKQDFKTFMKFYRKYPSIKWYDDELGKCQACYFPQYASIYSKKTNNIIGQIDVTIEEGFKLIDYSEYKCG